MSNYIKSTDLIVTDDGTAIAAAKSAFIYKNYKTN